jgi:hypothetical protein
MQTFKSREIPLISKTMKKSRFTEVHSYRPFKGMYPALLPGSSAEKWASPPPPFTNGRPNTGGWMCPMYRNSKPWKRSILA